jgi:hypothetical protein
MPSDYSPSDYSMMLRTAGQVQGAMSATCVDLLSRCCRFAANGAAVLARAAVEPLRTPPEWRQSAVEDALWTAYAAHEETLRALTGVSSLSMLIFLNQLDMRRGPRPAQKGVTDELWGQ